MLATCDGTLDGVHILGVYICIECKGYNDTYKYDTSSSCKNCNYSVCGNCLFSVINKDILSTKIKLLVLAVAHTDLLASQET